MFKLKLKDRLEVRVGMYICPNTKIYKVIKVNSQYVWLAWDTKSEGIMTHRLNESGFDREIFRQNLGTNSYEIVQEDDARICPKLREFKI